MRPSLAALPARRRLLAAAMLLVIAAACGSTEPRAIPIEQTTFADSLKIDLAKFTRLSSGVYVRDSLPGSGVATVNGQNVTVSYVGFLPTGFIFDQSNTARPNIPFTLGSSNVIAGFNAGVLGMKVGGRRRMIIPAELGYYDTVVPGIPTYSVLLFDVTLLSIQ